MDNKVELSVLGFSFNKTQSSTYGLVLSELKGLRRLMIVVGSPEAQSIAFQLQKSVPPRPLAHDLFRSLLFSLEITLSEVLIHQYVDGVFHAKMIFEQNGKQVEIESRTSDAVGIALRTSSPIYTTEEIMQDLAVVFNENDEMEEVHEEMADLSYDFSLLDAQDLKELLSNALKDEDYELATILRDELKKK